jgi:Chalcone and stilbene synthases, N-terminal domain
MAQVHGQHKSAKSMATVLAIGTAVPENIIYQSDYPDWYFRVTKCEHHTEFKEKLTRICNYIMHPIN